MRTLSRLLAFTFLLPVFASLEAQTRVATPVSVGQLDTVRLALDTVPRTISVLVAKTTLPEPVVRSAIAKLLTAKEVRYRLIPVASGDTTASGRPRRERAYYTITQEH